MDPTTLSQPPTDWSAGLQSLEAGSLCNLDISGMQSIGDEGDGYADEDHGTSARVPVTAYSYHPRVRSYEDLRMIADAREHVGILPVNGECKHLLLGGRYNPWSIVPAVAEMTGQRIAELTMATLSYSRSNADDLISMIDEGTIGHVSLLVAHVFGSKNPQLYQPLAAELRKRGQTVGMYRTHAKIFLIKLDDGRTFTFEGSANMRSCKCIEQAVFTDDAGLYAWHHAWLAGVFDQIGEKLMNGTPINN